MSSGFVTVATWEGGYTLDRLISTEGLRDLPWGHSVLLKKRKYFVIRKDGDPKYWFLLDKHGDLSYARIVTWGEELLPSLRDRSILFSALVDVLEISPSVTGSSYRGDSRAVFEGPLLPIFLSRPDIDTALKQEAELESLAAEISSIYPSEISKKTFSRDLLWKTRRAYQNAASNVLQSIRQSGGISQMPAIDSSAALGWDVTPRPGSNFPLAHSKQKVSTFFTAGSKTSKDFFLTVTLDFVPEPSWDVRIVAPDTNYWRSQDIDFNRETEYLVRGAQGPISAVLEAGLVIDDDDPTLWLDTVLKGVPEPEETFDLEVYRLLNQPSPLLWETAQFIEWLETNQG